jgi:arylsulfatase A-like enzyme
MIKMNVTQQFIVFLPFFVQGPLSRFFPELKQSPTLADPEHLQKATLSHIESIKKRRWMGVVFFSTAHFPYAAPEPYYRLFSKSDYKGPYLFKKDPEVKVSGKEFNSDDIDQIRALYKGSLRAIDDSIGEIEKILKRRNIWDQTTVVFTADHGEQIYDDRLLQGHGEHLQSEVVLKVPLFIKLPKGQIPKVQKIDSLSQPSDLLPTLLGLIGIQNDHAMSGYDYSNAIYGKGPRRDRPYAYSETGIWFSRTGAAHFQSNRLDYPGISGLLDFDQGRSNEMVLDDKFENMITIAKHRAIMTKEYKLIYMPTSEGVKFELYNRLLDPDNLRNLIELEKEKGEAMKAILKDHIHKYDDKYRYISDFLLPAN